MAHPSIIAGVARYSAPARLLHWLVAVTVLFAWPLGAVIKFVKDDVKLTFYLFHEGFGFIVLWFMLARLAVRLILRPPPHPPMPWVLHWAANTVHGLLYLALIVQPVSGFLATNAHGFPLKWFGLVDVWSPIAKSPEIAPVFSAIHVVTGWAIVVLFALHMGGVVFHHVIRRDATLYRML